MVDAIIKLFDQSATDFSSNGIGYLSDIVSCTVNEELNGEFELEFEYPISGKRYSEIKLRSIIVAKVNPYSTPQAFRIYSISKPFNGMVTYNASHISYDLSGYPVKIFTGKGATDTMSKMKPNMVTPNPFIFETNVTANASETVEVYEPTSSRAVLGGMEGSVIERFGGEFEFDNFTVKLLTARGTDRGVSIRYRKNLTDMTQEENGQELYSHIYPFYSDFDSEGNDEVVIGSLIKTNESFNFYRIYPLDLTGEFESKPTVTQVNNAAKKWLNNNKSIGEPNVNLNVSFATLGDTLEYSDVAVLEQVMIGDTVHVDYTEMGISASTRCIKTSYNVLTNKYISVELGSIKPDLASTISGMSTSISSGANSVNTKQVTSIVEKVVQQATGVSGGYVILRDDNSDGKIDELLIMDKPSIDEAVNIWKWDYNGLSYSSSGRTGNFSKFIGQNGGVDATFLSVGAIYSKNKKLKFDIDLNAFIAENFGINADGSIALIENPLNYVAASKLVAYDSMDKEGLVIDVEEDVASIDIKNEVTALEIKSHDKKVLKAECEGVDILRQTNTDPYYAKQIRFTNNGFVLKVGTPSSSSRDFTNNFVFTRDANGNLIQIKNTDSGLTLDIRR